MRKERKENTNKQTYTMKQAFHEYNRMIKRMWHEVPALIVLDMFETIWSALIPYLHIYVSALFFDELAGARRPDEIRFYVLLILLTSVATAAVPVILGRIRLRYPLDMNYWMESKLAELDFADADNPETHLLKTKIHQSTNAGKGIYKVWSEYRAIVQSILTILGGVSLTVSLFLIKVPASGGRLTVLNHPVFVLFLIVLMLGITCLSPLFDRQANRIWSSHATDHVQGNSEFGYYAKLGYYQSDASDVRMYRQERQLDGWARGTSMQLFCSKGLFAKLTVRKIGPLHTLSSVISVIFTGFTYLFVCLKALGGAFGVGAITQYVTSIGRVSTGVSQLIKNLGDMQINAPFVKTTFDYLETPNKMYQGSLTVEKRMDREYEIEFHHVSFKYPGSDTYSLKDVNMKFKVGSRLAVVGMNGSGKSTFIKLLCRLYDPTEGEILLNGIDIRKYDYRNYMSVFSVVFQDFSLLCLTLGQVVAGALDYDRERVTTCLIEAGLGDRLAALPEGLDTYRTKEYDKDGIEFSGGEMQKIAIARALYKNAPFIILDEPTAALDSLAEAAIYSKFNEIAGDKTAIYISHRLSSCKFCDEIAVFHEGAVVQMGTHEGLLRDESGKYRELWFAQAQYYTE